ncbi:MAG: hypothetical protein AB7U92_22855 [Piscinibacter sp.]|uniref:hypothetical protein n=1 Tax=Piscinibacter sp. TaxID=1903157 RepID=UPI003D0AA58A
MSRFLRCGACAAALGLAALAQAQPARPAPDPLDPKAVVPPAQHRSALAGYRPLAEAPVGSWKEANERVNRIGGWRTYAREAAQPAAPSESAAQPAPAPASAAHRH